MQSWNILRPIWYVLGGLCDSFTHIVKGFFTNTKKYLNELGSKMNSMNLNLNLIRIHSTHNRYKQRLNQYSDMIDLFVESFSMIHSSGDPYFGTDVPLT